MLDLLIIAILGGIVGAVLSFAVMGYMLAREVKQTQAKVERIEESVGEAERAVHKMKQLQRDYADTISEAKTILSKVAESREEVDDEINIENGEE